MISGQRVSQVSQTNWCWLKADRLTLGGAHGRRIARKEFIEMLRDGRFRWSAAIILVLLAAALGMGWKGYREVRAQHELARRRRGTSGSGSRPRTRTRRRTTASTPSSRSSCSALLDRGVDAYTGVAVWLEAHKQNEFKFRPAQDATAVQRFGELTAATVMQLLLPLLIVLLTFSAFAGEREQGTLRQLLSLGVKPTDLIFGKALGVAAALGALLVPATAVGRRRARAGAEEGRSWRARRASCSWGQLPALLWRLRRRLARRLGARAVVAAGARHRCSPSGSSTGWSRRAPRPTSPSGSTRRPRPSPSPRRSRTTWRAASTGTTRRTGGPRSSSGACSRSTASAGSRTCR